MMSEEQKESDQRSWMSTYGLITANRILEIYNIRLQQEELYSAISNPQSFYYRILTVPLKNVFNGIIMEQAKDYQIYAQKMFIDYLMSGESSKPEEAPGGNTREDLESERKSLVEMAEKFDLCETEQVKLIGESQKNIIQKAQEWQKLLVSAVKEVHSNLNTRAIKKSEELVRKVINVLLVLPEFTAAGEISLQAESWSRAEKIFGESIDENLRQVFIEKIDSLREYNNSTIDEIDSYFSLVSKMGANIRNWRSSFHDFILRVAVLLKLLPEYHSNTAQIVENQAALYFDTQIGEESK